MCGRYTLTVGAEEIIDHFGALSRYADLAAHLPRYNVAPGQTMPIVRAGVTAPELVAAHWGLIPFWAKDAAIGAHLFNARADTVAVKPAFKAAFKRRRCLIPADGFYEWKTEGPARGPKQAYRFVLKEGGLFAFAGIWERWANPDGQAVESYAIITTAANATLKPIHERMPVIVPREHYTRWLGMKRDPAFALTLIEPVPNGVLRAVPVGNIVNNATHDAPECIAPIELPAMR